LFSRKEKTTEHKNKATRSESCTRGKG